jgi:hypothetical protein
MDARISTDFPNHPKTKRLIRRLGFAGAWHLLKLWLWAAANKPSGDLAGLTSEDLELAVDWPGDADALVQGLLDVRFLIGEAGAYRLKDWAAWNPWASGADLRAAKARWNAVKRHHGIPEANRQVPEWARHLEEQRSASAGNSGDNSATSSRSDAGSMRSDAVSNAPSPSPSPSPTATATTDRPTTLADAGGSFEGQEPAAGLAPLLGTLPGRACRMMREAGAAITNPSHPELLAALAEGVQPETLAHCVREAIDAGKKKPFAYAIATARSRHAEGAKQINEGGRGNGSSTAGGSDRGGSSAVDRVARNIERARRERGEGAEGWIEGEASDVAD